MKKFDFRPAPFWFLNHKLEDSEIVRQLDLMKTAGVSGFFMHPRAGNYPQTYGSKEWFLKIKFIESEAAKRGLKVWLYDEDPYPSGAAGGRIFFERPEFIAYRMRLVKYISENGELDIELGQCKVLCAYAILRKNGKVTDKIDITDSVGVIRDKFFMSKWDSPYYCDMMGKIKFPHVRAETFYPKMAIKSKIPAGYTVYAVVAEQYHADEKYGFLPDELNEKCTEEFIRLTHEKYKKYLGSEFGKNVLGVFTDEPAPGAYLPYTGRLFELFKKKHGYSLQEKLYNLFEDVDENSGDIRLDYFTFINSLLRKNFYKKLHTWCKKNKLMLTGHIVCEEDLVSQASVGENVYHSLKYFDIPGFDITGNNIGDNDHYALCIGGKVVSSAAHQSGKKIVMSELMSNSPFNYNLEGMNRISYFMYALGINFLVPHGFHFSYDGYRKFDAGSSLSYQFRDFDKFPKFSKMAEKYGKLLSRGEHVCDTCIVLPMRELYRNVSVNIAYAKELFATVVAAAKYLGNNHIEYDFIDEETLASCRKEGQYIVVGREKYKNVFAFAESRKEIGDCGIKTLDIRSISETRLPGCVMSRITALNGDVKRLMSYRRKIGETDLYYLFNNGRGQVEFMLGVSDDAEIIPPYGKTLKAEVKDGKVRIILDGYDALIVLSGKKSRAAKTYAPGNYDPNKITRYEWEDNPEWEYFPKGEKGIAVDNYDIKITSDKGEELYENQHYCLVRDVHGTTREYMKANLVVPIFDEVGKKVITLYPVNAEYTARFNLKGDESLMVMEGETLAGNAKIYLNGKEISLSSFENKIIYDFKNLVLDVGDIIKKGENILEIKFADADEFDGLRSRIYFFRKK